MYDYEIDEAIESIMNDMDMYDYDDYAVESNTDAWKTYGALTTGVLAGQAAVAMSKTSWNRGLANGLHTRTLQAIASGNKKEMKEVRRYLVAYRDETMRRMTDSQQTIVIRACEENIALLDGALKSK